MGPLRLTTDEDADVRSPRLGLAVQLFQRSRLLLFAPATQGLGL